MSCDNFPRTRCSQCNNDIECRALFNESYEEKLIREKLEKSKEGKNEISDDAQF